ncbi:MAG: diacylglycerol/lipid kinase family protein [Lachnospiraceae bacterium]
MYYFIVNLTSRTGKAAEVWRQIKAELDSREIVYKAYVSEYPGHAMKLAQKICNRADEDIRLIVVGGDGTVNEVINGMEHFEKVRFGYIPSGSGNDLGRGLGIEAKKPLEALSRILEAKEEYAIDLGRVSWEDGNRLFAISSGVGFDALVCEKALHSKIKTFLNRIGLGKLVYLVLTVQSMMGLEAEDAEISFEDGAVYPLKKMIFAAAMNQPFEGGGVPMAPKASCTDGQLSVIYVEDIPKGKMPLMLLRLLRKKHHRIKGCHLKDTTSYTVRSKIPLVVHADGEFCGYRNEIHFEVEPKKLRLLYK